MSAYLEKQKLLEWLKLQLDLSWMGDPTQIYRYGKEDTLKDVVREIKSGTFDWQPND